MSDFPIEGVDVSGWQENLDTVEEWRQVRSSGVSVAIVKATEGVSYRSKSFEKQANSAHGAGLVVGGYHFVRLGDGSAQAKYFLDFALTRAQLQFAMLDIEWPSKWGSVDCATYSRGAVACAAEIARHLPIAIYTSRKEAVQLLSPGHGLGKFSLLAPAYGSNDGYAHELPKLPHGWTELWGHQYTSGGRVAGYERHIDRFRCRSERPRTWIPPLP